MFGKLAEAIHLLLSNIALFSLIVLTVWLPGNLVTEYLAFNILSEDDVLSYVKLGCWIEGLFGPLYVGALLFAVNQRNRGEKVGYLDAMAVGFRNWGRLFVARFVAGLIILLGFIALVVPGIVFTVRYALLDAAVVLEGAGAERSRERSVTLTTGMRWRIFGVGVIFLVGYTLFCVVATLPLAFVEQLDTIIGNVVVDCILDVAYTVIQITLFLFYSEARETEQASVEAPFEPATLRQADRSGSVR